MKLRAIFIEIISLLLIVLFVYAAASKLLDIDKFSAQIGQSPILTAVAPLLSWAIPFLEFGVALLLASMRYRLIGMYAAFFLMFTFTVYVIAVLRFSPYVPCACGGVIETLGWKGHLYFNIAFTALSYTGVWLQSKHLRTSDSFS